MSNAMSHSPRRAGSLAPRLGYDRSQDLFRVILQGALA